MDAEAVGFGLPRHARLRHAYEFRRVYGRGVRAHGKHLVVVAFERRSPGHRLGIAVSKEHGKAVRRTKIKRLLREAFRLARPTLAGRFDLVLIPQRRDGKYQLGELQLDLVELVQRIHAGQGRSRRNGRAEGRPNRRSGKRRAARDGDLAP